jgi:hypothetical protein
MKKILSFFAIAAMLFTACEKPVDENTEQIKLISENVVKVGSGSAMGLIQYEILEMIEGAEVKAEADVNWISNFDLRNQGKIQFTTEKNPDGEPREGNIIITYDKSTLNVKIIQALSENPTNKEIKSPLLQGKYYGSYSGSNGLHNYYFALTDLGMDASNMFDTPNAYYYFVDLYLDVEPNDMSHIQAPVGVYEFDANNMPIGDTFKEQWSWYQINDESGIDASQTHYESGILTVEENKVTLEITMTIDHVQETHKVVYEGDYSLLDCRNETY